MDKAKSTQSEKKQMNSTRTLIKKIIYKTLGEGGYKKAYAKGKIKDIKNGVLDEKEALFLPHFIKPTSTVLDIGANYGHYAIDMARICTSGMVYAFEPVPFTFGVLEKIVTYFKSKNIVLFHAAVSNSAGEIDMTIPLLDFGAPNTGVAFIGKQKEKQSKNVTVKTLKIDDLTIKGEVDFIKIDIEGHEPQAFKGMENLLKKHRPVILIEFSHACLKRANSNPDTFATYLQNEMAYKFAKINGEKLVLETNPFPADGYYFLFPTEKINAFQNLFT